MAVDATRCLMMSGRSSAWGTAVSPAARSQRGASQRLSDRPAVERMAGNRGLLRDGYVTDTSRLQRPRQAVAIGQAEVAAITATVFAGSALGACWWVVSTRVSRTIRTRNLRSSVSQKLQEAQLELLAGGQGPEEAADLRRRVAKLRIMQRQMEQEAEDGNAIQGRNQVPQLTPLAYLQKSLKSALRDTRGAPEGKLRQVVNAVNLIILLLLVLQLGEIL